MNDVCVCVCACLGVPEEERLIDVPRSSVIFHLSSMMKEQWNRITEILSSLTRPRSHLREWKFTTTLWKWKHTHKQWGRMIRLSASHFLNLFIFLYTWKWFVKFTSMLSQNIFHGESMGLEKRPEILPGLGWDWCFSIILVHIKGLKSQYALGVKMWFLLGSSDSSIWNLVHVLTLDLIQID